MGEAALAREFRTDPPRWELDGLRPLWRDYLWRYVDAGRQDPCVAYTAKAETIADAIIRACDSRGENGKMFFHQGRVWQVNRDAYATALLKRRALRELSDAQNFEDIFRTCDRVGQRTHGIGRVTIYDVTSRLAAFYRYEAEWLHFHAGVLEGLTTLMTAYDEELPEDELWTPPASGRLHRSELPLAWMRKANMDLMESFLCGYRSEIERVLWTESEDD